MVREVHPALDAEKTDRGKLLANFRSPPDVQTDVARGTLIVGARGSGKTMFLRRCKHLHTSGVALYGDLRKILNPLSSDTGSGGLSFDSIPPSLEAAIQAKTIFLLTIWFAEQAHEREVPIPLRALQRVFPRTDRSIISGEPQGFLLDLIDLNHDLRLEDIPAGNYLTSFLEFMTALADACDQVAGPLLILLDRAEEIPYPCLTPVLSLLDQTHPFTSVVATRPGILGPDQLLTSDTPIPGDHYDVRHLGSTPYSVGWREFQISALRAWIPSALAEVPEEDLSLLLSISRDSIRHALEIVYNSIDESMRYQRSLALQRIDLLRSTLLSAAQGQLRRLNGDLKDLIRRLRRGDVHLPILLRLESAMQRPLTEPQPLREMSRDERMVRLALRTAFFSTQHGDVWHPYAAIEAVEITPIFIWREGDTWHHIPFTD